MAQQYWITIRYPNTESNNKTIPGNNSDGKVPTIPDIPTGGGDENPVKIPGILPFIKNPSITKLLGNMGALGAGVLMVKQIYDIAENIATTLIPYQAGYTGDTNLEINYTNAKNAIHGVFHPLSQIQAGTTYLMEKYRENLKIQYNRETTGNAIINTYGGKTSN